MGLEIATHISDLVATNPGTGDPLAQGDDHIRMLKAVLLASFPLVNGPLNASMVAFTPTGGLAATTVSGALAELDSEKAAKGVFTNGEFTFGATVRLLGRTTAGAGAGEEISIGTGLTLSAGVLACSVTGGVTTFNTRSGAVTLSSGDVTTALGFTPLSSAPVTSVNGNTGAITAAQISAAATTGYGYTPANPAALSYVAKDNGYNSIGSFSVLVNQAGGTIAAGATVSGASMQFTNGANWGSTGGTPSGTWRNLGGQLNGYTGSNLPCGLFQRIA